MYDSVNDVNSLIKYVSASDKRGKSKDDIDTEEEYSCLGYLLNNGYVSLSGGVECRYEDLSSEDKKILFEKVKALESKFGRFENKFAEEVQLNSENVRDYLDRCYCFYDKLKSFETESERQVYYNDIKQELSSLENKINNYLSKYGIKEKVNSENINEIIKQFGELYNDIWLTEFNKKYDKNFKIDIDNAQNYLRLLERLMDENYEPVLISKEEKDKVVNILKKEYVEFVRPHLNEEVNEDNILEDLSIKIRTARNKIYKQKEAVEKETVLKNLLNDSEKSFKVTNDNALDMNNMLEFLKKGKSAGILSEEERNKVLDILNRNWIEYASKYLTDEQLQDLSTNGQMTEINSRIEAINNGTYKKFESKIVELLQTKGKDFKITVENANLYGDIYKYLYDKKLDSSVLSEQEFQQAREILAKPLIEFLKPFSCNDFSEENLPSNNITYLLNDAVKGYQKLERMDNCGKIVQSAIQNPYDNKILQNIVEKYIKDNNVQKLVDVPDGIDVGNGKFDGISTQKTENCWIHAGINSLLPTDEGRLLVESNYYRDPVTGVVAVHIPEAEAFGVDNGIFIVTPEEIIAAYDTIAAGEGDITAYILAIQKYFDKVEATPELKEKLAQKRIFSGQDDGNGGFRFYELMTAGYHTELRDSDGITGKQGVRPGIGISTNFNTECLYDMLEKKKGAVVISLRQAGHSISIVGVKDGKFLIQESNNEPDFYKYHLGENGNPIFTSEPDVNGRPTFGISIENLSKYSLGAINYIMWQ